MSITPMDLHHRTVPQLRDELRKRCERGFDNGIEPNADGTYGLPKPISKMRKAELIDAVVKAARQQEKQEAAEAQAQRQVPEEIHSQADMDATLAAPDTYAPLHEQPTTGSPAAIARVEEADLVDVASEAAYAEMASQIDARVAKLREEERAQAQAARAVGQVAWANTDALVQVGRRLVLGKVVDTVLRTPDATGGGRVCLVVEHTGAPVPRRTLHALRDVMLEPVAS